MLSDSRVPVLDLGAHRPDYQPPHTATDPAANVTNSSPVQRPELLRDDGPRRQLSNLGPSLVPSSGSDSL